MTGSRWRGISCSDRRGRDREPRNASTTSGLSPGGTALWNMVPLGIRSQPTRPASLGGRREGHEVSHPFPTLTFLYHFFIIHFGTRYHDVIITKDQLSTHSVRLEYLSTWQPQNTTLEWWWALPSSQEQSQLKKSKEQQRIIPPYCLFMVIKLITNRFFI